jgi:hypothetical protein
MKPRHILVAGSISEQATCRAARSPAPRTDSWKSAFLETGASSPTQKPREASDRSIIHSGSDDIKILSIRRPDFEQEERPIKVVSLQDLMLGEDWRVKELERLVNNGKKRITLMWIAGVASVSWCVGNMALNPKISASPSLIGVSVAVLAVTVAILITALKYFKKINLLAEQELQKAREELGGIEANK